MSKFEDRAIRYITDLVRDFQLDDFQAAGFPGNFGVETGGFEQVQEIDPIGGGRGGLGDAQWTGPRRREFEAWLANRGSRGQTSDPHDYSANYSMLFRDLEGGEGHRVLPKLRQARTVDEATEIVMREYERPGVEHLERRKEYGRKALDAFRAAGIDVAALKAQGRPAGSTQVLSPGQSLAPHEPDLIGKLLPVILQSVLPIAMKQIQGGQSHLDIAAIIKQTAEAIKTQAPPPAGTPVSERPSVWLSALTAIGAAALQAHGDLGTPVGPNATTTGLMTNVLTVGSTVFAAVGGWAGIGRMALKIFALIPK